MSLLCYCFWLSLRASSICFVSSFSHGLCMQYSDCSVLMTLFSHIFVLLFPFLCSCISLQLCVVITFTKLFSTELLGSQWQVLGIGGRGGGKGTWLGFRKGSLMLCSTNLSSGYPTSICNFGTAHQIVLCWRHLTSTVTLQELRCHTEDLNCQFGFKLKVLLTYLALYLCQQRNGRQCQKSFQKLTQSSVKLRLVSIVEKKWKLESVQCSCTLYIVFVFIWKLCCGNSHITVMFYELNLTFNATLHEELIKGDFVQERFCQECKCIFIAKRNYSEYRKYELIQFYQALLCDAVQLSGQNLEPAIWRSRIWVLLWPIVRLVSHELWAQLLSYWMLVNNQLILLLPATGGF